MVAEWDKLKFPSQPLRQYPLDRNRILSAVVVGGWLALCALGGGPHSLLNNMIEIALPAACVWFPEELGSLTTTLIGMPITRSSPAFLVRIVGWVALLILTVVRMVVFVAMKP